MFYPGKERLVHEPEHEEAIEAECEITDLGPQKKSNQALNRWLHGQRFSFRTRLCMALFTILGVALFSWLLVSPLHLTRPSHGPIFTPSYQAPSGYEQVLVVQKVIYLIDQNGLVKATWTRHKYVYLLWQHSVAPSSRLLRVDHNVLYLTSPGGHLVALRTSDGSILWTK